MQTPVILPCPACSQQLTVGWPALTALQCPACGNFFTTHGMQAPPPQPIMKQVQQPSAPPSTTDSPQQASSPAPPRSMRCVSCQKPFGLPPNAKAVACPMCGVANTVPANTPSYPIRPQDHSSTALLSNQPSSSSSPNSSSISLFDNMPGPPGYPPGPWVCLTKTCREYNINPQEVFCPKCKYPRRSPEEEARLAPKKLQQAQSALVSEAVMKRTVLFNLACNLWDTVSDFLGLYSLDYFPCGNSTVRGMYITSLIAVGLFLVLSLFMHIAWKGCNPFYQLYEIACKKTPWKEIYDRQETPQHHMVKIYELVFENLLQLIVVLCVIIRDLQFGSPGVWTQVWSWSKFVTAAIFLFYRNFVSVKKYAELKKIFDCCPSFVKNNEDVQSWGYLCFAYMGSLLMLYFCMVFGMLVVWLAVASCDKVCDLEEQFPAWGRFASLSSDGCANGYCLVGGADCFGEEGSSTVVTYSSECSFRCAEGYTVPEVSATNTTIAAVAKCTQPTKEQTSSQGGGLTSDLLGLQLTLNKSCVSCGQRCVDCNYATGAALCQKCWVGWAVDSVTKECVDCGNGCITCTAENGDVTCQQCEDGFGFHPEGRCVRCADFYKSRAPYGQRMACKTCNYTDPYKCLSCYEDSNECTELTASGTCQCCKGYYALRESMCHSCWYQCNSTCTGPFPDDCR